MNNIFYHECQMPVGLPEFAVNPENHVPVVLLLDTSGSMANIHFLSPKAGANYILRLLQLHYTDGTDAIHSVVYPLPLVLI